jgi:hypothetical protein
VIGAEASSASARLAWQKALFTGLSSIVENLNLSGYILIDELLRQQLDMLHKEQNSKYTQIYFDQSLLNFILLVKSGRFLCRSPHWLSHKRPHSLRYLLRLAPEKRPKNSLNDNQSPAFPAI